MNTRKNLFQKHCKLFISLKFNIKEIKYRVKPLDPSRTNTSFLSDHARFNIEPPHYFLKNITNPPRSLQHFVVKMGNVRTALLDPRATLFWCMNLRRIWERIVTFSHQRFSDFWCKSVARTPPIFGTKKWHFGIKKWHFGIKKWHFGIDNIDWRNDIRQFEIWMHHEIPNKKIMWSVWIQWKCQKPKSPSAKTGLVRKFPKWCYCTTLPYLTHEITFLPFLCFFLQSNAIK